MQVTLMRAEPGEDHAPTKFSISEVQGDRSSCKLDCCSLWRDRQYTALHI